VSGGETDRNALLRNLEPRLGAEELVYCTVGQADFRRLELDPVCTFREAEGITLIVTRADAERCKLASSYPCRMITLTVHSSLDAVGVLAAVASKLAQEGISVNVVSAYYHDHLFVPAEAAERALAAIRELQA